MADELNMDTWRRAMAQSASQWDDNVWGLLPEQRYLTERYADEMVAKATQHEQAVTMEALWWFAQGAATATAFFMGKPYTAIPSTRNVPHLITCALASRLLAGSIPLPDVPVADDLDPDDAAGGE